MITSYLPFDDNNTNYPYTTGYRHSALKCMVEIAKFYAPKRGLDEKGIKEYVKAKISAQLESRASRRCTRRNASATEVDGNLENGNNMNGSRVHSNNYGNYDSLCDSQDTGVVPTTAVPNSNFVRNPIWSRIEVDESNPDDIFDPVFCTIDCEEAFGEGACIKSRSSSGDWSNYHSSPA
eukprot:CAMPEP_0171330692 /NCGR_PEP_ID=MMETSP0878-20121228/2189_1 /TAXON_ID=67004 /ORGANISM="Thalassiosira weissflogii, Strain CCMP1336" /LENGTH=178 /DNA_ID=CAMNT_0011831061 /DNA_START=81 /DNA_END=617 /DNA_ORIENTATION=-